MPNLTHLKVLLSKDYLTLKRNIGFVITFVFLPLSLMIAFIEIQGLVNNGYVEGSQIAQNFRYTNTQFLTFPGVGRFSYFFMDKPPADPNTKQIYVSTLQSCQKQNQGKYWFSKIGIVAEDPNVRQDLIDYWNNYVLKYQAWPTNWTVEGFANEDDINEIIRDTEQQPYCFAVNVKNFDLVNDQYDIQFNFIKTVVTDTSQPAYSDLIKTPDLGSWTLWLNSGAPQMYSLLTEFIARKKLNAPVSAPAPLFLQQVGYAPMQNVRYMSITTQALSQLANNFPFFYMIIQLIPFYYLTSKISSEKESKAREGMKMMGLTDDTYYLAWLIVYSIITFVTSIIVTVMCAIGVFDNINMFMFFVMCFLYGMCMYGQAFFIVAFLPSKRSSGIAATLFHIITYYMVFILQDPATPSTALYSFSLLPNICMVELIKQIFFYNYNTRDGLTWSTLGIQYQNYSFKGGILVLLLDTLVWGFIGLYLDQVVPSQFGVAKPWNFMCKSKKKIKMAPEKVRLLESNLNENPRNFEAVADQIKKQEQTNECLKVRGLVRKFGPKTAVAGVNLTMYNGQIFALLGHNGAGKTTTISMLTGLIEPTEGYAEVFGTDIFNNMEEVRKNLGVCPQHDVLFEFLTPEDHLRLFAAFKGTEQTKIPGLVAQMLEDIDLTIVKDQISKTLSGGQKRKLSVAIAMIGDSKVVMLDEPTSGMDTAARRRLWEMLKKNKAGRIVILTTHYMDEADILGDRIAIMAEGKVQCTGSSLFLKNRYGVGYNLVVAKKERLPAPHIDEFINARINGVKKMQEVSSEISYQLPTKSSKQFKNFFHEFDSKLDELGIRSYGVGITTLEEVFLKIGHGEIEEDETNNHSIELDHKINNTHNESKAIELGYGDQDLENYSIATDREPNVFMMQLKAMLRKKLLMQVRDSKTLSIDTIFPIMLIMVGFALATVSFFKDGPSRLMTPFIYPTPLNLVYNSNSSLIPNANLTDIQNFMTNDVQALNASAITLSQGTGIVTNPDNDPDLDIFAQLTQYDNYIFDLVQNKGHPEVYGQIYVNSLNSEYSQEVSIGYSLCLLLNSTSQDVVGTWGAFANVAILKHYLEANQIDTSKMQINFEDQPFPVSKSMANLNKTIAGTNSAILMTIAWLMISDSLIQNVIKERQKNIKHQMIVSGSSLVAYWLSMYIADVMFQAIPATVAILGSHWFSIDVPEVQWLFLAVIFANPAFIYAFSFLFEKDETGSFVVKMFYFCFGMIAPIAISVLQVVNSTTIEVADVLRWFFYPIPVYSLTFGYMSIAQRQIIQFVQKLPNAPAPLSTQVAGLSLWFLCGAVPVYWLIVALFELGVFEMIFGCKKKQQEVDLKTNDRHSTFMGDMPHDDTDIIAEQRRVKGTQERDVPIRIEDLRKNYGNIKAVRNLSLGLSYGECFALLGISGAGKTSVFKCLTRETLPTSGKVTINGHDVTTNAGFDMARRQIGYCPQFDTIFEGLTVLEHLQIYGAIKGIKKSLLPRICDKAIKDMDLGDYVHIRANNLSGGNKRKMAVALALLGNPPLVFLDEPSTGVDPQAKRFMWNIVSKISTQKGKSAVIITTHSMEEAEALCTKMGIMVDGQFKCFGSSQHIKDKYGTGYELEIKIRTLTEQESNEYARAKNLPQKLDRAACEWILNENGWSFLIEEMKENGQGEEFHRLFKEGQKVDTNEFLRWQFAEGQGNKAVDYLETLFREFIVLEHYGNSFKLKVSRDNYSIGFLFGLMEDIQQKYDISEYSVAQTTLEQIFNNFALEAERVNGAMRKNNPTRRSTKKSRASKMSTQTTPL